MDNCTADFILNNSCDKPSILEAYQAKCEQFLKGIEYHQEKIKKRKSNYDIAINDNDIWLGKCIEEFNYYAEKYLDLSLELELMEYVVYKGKRFLKGHGYATGIGYKFHWTEDVKEARSFKDKKMAEQFANMTDGRVVDNWCR